MAKIFISYRRSDAKWAAGRICDHLLAEFGEGSVFLDTVTIEPGDDFVEVIGKQVEACYAIVAVIGPLWLDTLRHRAEEPDDYLRIELEQAIQRGVRFIPLTIDDVIMPTKNDLPKSLKPLARRNAVPLRADTFRSDIAPLVAFLNRFLDEAIIPLEVAASAKPTAELRPNATGDLRLNHQTKFWKTGTDGLPRRKIHIWVEGVKDNLDRIEKIVYKLDPTFKNPIREIFDRESSFELHTNGWGPFKVKAMAHYFDGGEPSELWHYIAFD